MRRNASQNMLGKHHKSTYMQPDFHRSVYINEENNRKDNSTIFHSPYKNGKRNPSYTNPSFMSSDLFYPRIEHNDKIVKKGIVPNPNDVKKEDLRNQRLQRTNSQLLDIKVSSPERVQEPPRPYFNMNDRLKRQLELVKKHRDEVSANHSKSKSPGKSLRKQPRTPVYLEREVDAGKKRAEVRKILNKYLNQALRTKDALKQEKQNEKKTDKRLIDVSAEKFKAQVVSSKQFEKQRSMLLKEMLLNQRK